MNNLSKTAHLLAADGRGWQIRRAADGMIQLDVALACLLLTDAELLEVHQLAEAALAAPDERDVPAWSGPSRAIWRCPHGETLALVFDRAILRFHRREFPRFACLCRQAASALGPLTSDVMPPSVNMRDRLN
jgi:hypothetical protein